MKKTLAGLMAAAATVSIVAAATPAQAYDKDAYVYAAGHMLQSDDIPSSLGTFGKSMFFNASSGSKIYVCYVNSNDITAKPQSAYLFNANFSDNSKDGNGNSISQAVYQYASAKKAISAYESLTKAIKGCTGTTTNSWTDDDTGVTQTSTSLTTNGKVPAVTEVGVESVFINTNYLSTSSDGKDKYTSDSYTVFTLVNDVIISTGYSTGNLENIPTKQRKQVNQLAFDGISRWLG